MAFAQSAPSPLPPVSFAQSPSPEGLRRMNIHLDQLLLALVALTDLDEDTWNHALGKVTSSVAPSSSLPRHYPPGKTAIGQLNVQGIRTLVMAIAYLSQQYQELLRRSVSLIEQTTDQGKNPLQTALLGEYGQSLQSAWESYQVKQGFSVPFLTEERILALLTELFFYSSPDGARRLWRVLENMEFPANS